LADAFELLAERDDRNKVRRFEYAWLKRLAAHSLFEWRPCGKDQAVETNGWAPLIYVFNIYVKLKTDKRTYTAC